ncbi:MAG: CDP-diacylglycerol--glycerol-3-phosphate 3-phosphatidyltransferase [Candidatus Sericytochromatia bacterium]|nr:CDP-diacylglycerol--glycerol-3-phosphate 3-phosphatidyltransferase [Candidatus Sericytochromatia bacterium]
MASPSEVSPVRPDRPPPPLTLATWVTLFRFVLVPPIVWSMAWAPSAAGDWRSWIPLGLFSLAAASDWIDGLLARRMGQTSVMGAWLDPLADKVLVAACLVAFVEGGRIPGWSVSLVLAREFLATGLRIVLADMGQGIRPAAWSGKAKAIAQMCSISAFLVPWPPLLPWATGLYALAVVLTVWSGVAMIWQTRAIWRSA